MNCYHQHFCYLIVLLVLNKLCFVTGFYFHLYIIISDRAVHIIKSYYYSYNMPVVILRPFNNYGPRQSRRAVIPEIICQILKKDPNKQIKYVRDRPYNDKRYSVSSSKIRKLGWRPA